MKPTFVLDTNVLLDDPAAIESYQKAKIVIPFKVIEELDKHKVSPGQLGGNARAAIRFLDALSKKGDTLKGVPCGSSTVIISSWGKEGVALLKANSLEEMPDNMIIVTALQFKGSTLVSNDLAMRLKAAGLGLTVAGYVKESAANSIGDIYSGTAELEISETAINLLYSAGEIAIPKKVQLSPNQYLHLKSNTNDKHTAIGKVVKDKIIRVVVPKEVFGLKPKNLEQAAALDALLDPDIALVSLLGKAGTGKAQPLDAKVLTPTGFVSMGGLKVGDLVVNADGEFSKILGVYPQGVKDIYRVVFSDGTSTECCKEHLWHTRTSLDRTSGNEGSVRSLEEIMKTLKDERTGKGNHEIPMTKPVRFTSKSLPLAPYRLGRIIGSSGSPISSDDTITSHEESVLGLLGLNNLSPNQRFVPGEYKLSATEDRLDMIQGLLDTDNSATTSGHICTFSSASIQLATDVKELVMSLGGRATVATKLQIFKSKSERQVGGTIYVTSITMPAGIIPFKTPKKASRYSSKTNRAPRRHISEVTFVGQKEAQCIMIDHKDHLYITDDFIVTHNTLVALASALEMVLHKHTYNKLMIIRSPSSVGAEIGWLPGNADEKMAVHFDSIYDSLDVLFKSEGDKTKDLIAQFIESGVIQMCPPTFMRGRSLPKTFILVDECQNLSTHEIKTIATRLGEGSKLIVIGDVNQIDTPKLDALNNGLTRVVEAFKNQECASHMTFTKGERSSFAELAAELL